MYLYFQIPLMVLVIFPASRDCARSGQEAARNLGASRWQYWRCVGGPLLAPPLLGALMLLFANAFASYATAQALTNGVIPLVPIEIGAVMSGNVAAGQENLGNALGFGMIVIVAIAMVGYTAHPAQGARGGMRLTTARRPIRAGGSAVRRVLVLPSPRVLPAADRRVDRVQPARLATARTRSTPGRTWSARTASRRTC